MSLKTENIRSSGNGSEKLGEAVKNLKILYTREFLLSLSGLDACKKLPSGFDESLLCEIADGMQSLQDRSRAPGIHHFQGFRRNDHGSSPPACWDSATLSGGSYRKIGTRSSVQSDRDVDSQSDRDSESGKHSEQKSQGSWHAAEHDGLLGSGYNSFSRLTGYAPGISAPKNKTSDNYQLKKSNEPYHPPRPCKAVPYLTRDTEYNDETFGSSDCISEDRVEEEKRRRASFEEMRKEQQKALQEKQILNLEHKVNDVPDLAVQHENKKIIHEDELQVLDAGSTLKNMSGKHYVLLSSTTNRPLVPPGFRNNFMDANPELKSNTQHALLKGEKFSIEQATLDPETSCQYDSIGLERFTDKKSEAESHLPHYSSRHLEDLESLKLSHQIVNDKAVVKSTSGDSASLLERIFWDPMSFHRHGVSSSSENNSFKPDNITLSPSSVHSSKFAKGFFEDEGRSANEVSSRRSDDILSLIVNGDKCRYPVSDDILLNNDEQSRKLFPEHDIPAILTCEDLENSILTEYNSQTTSHLPTSNPWIMEPSNEHVDDNASLHLLSLLQKNTENKEISFVNKPVVSQVNVVAKENVKNVVSSESGLTLEMLFGSAFMNELKSVEAPVSVQRRSSEVQAAEPARIHFSSTDTHISSSQVHDPNIGIPRLNVASHHPVLHQMGIPANYGSGSHMNDLTRVGIGSFHQENISHIPFPPKQRNLGHILPSTPGFGNSPPAAFQRLVEMEKSAQFKQAQQFASGRSH